MIGYDASLLIIDKLWMRFSVDQVREKIIQEAQLADALFADAFDA